jgi:proliferating cell nuclear antigen
MARTAPNDKMKIDLTESEMLIEIDNEVKRSFKLPLLDLSDEEVKLPEYSFDARIKINARLLKEALKDAALFSSTVVLKVEKNKFLIEAKSSAGTLLAATKSKGISIEAKQDVISKYSLSFLQNIVKGAENESEITLELKSDTALKASYAIGKSRIEFFLAHMIL